MPRRGYGFLAQGFKPGNGPPRRCALIRGARLGVVAITYISAAMSCLKLPAAVPIEARIAAAGTKTDRLSNPGVGYVTNTHESFN